MTDLFNDVDPSWFPDLRPILTSHPEVLGRLTLLCVGCDRLIRPRNMAQHDVVDLRQWNWASLDTVWDGLAFGPFGREDVGRMLTILPCGHIVCRRCLYRHSHFQSDYVLDKYNVVVFPNSEEDQVQAQEQFALHSDALIDEENQQREMESREDERHRMMDEGHLTQDIFDLTQGTCPVDDCRRCTSNLGYCLDDCPSWIQGVPFPTTVEQLHAVPLTQPEGQYVFANALAMRPMRFPAPGTHARTWIADMCHRCRAVREIARNMYAWNATHPTSERINICFVTDPTVRADFENYTCYATFHALSTWMTTTYHAKVAATPWNVPPAGRVSPDARFVVRPFSEPCMCTRGENTWTEDEVPCDMFSNWWLWGDAVVYGWSVCAGYVTRSRELGFIP